MTILENDRRKEYPGNGVAVRFTGPRAFNADHIAVYLVDASNVATPLTSGFTLTGIGTRNTVVTMDTAPASGTTLLILRTVPYEQAADISNQGAYFPETLEIAGLDPLAMQIQQLADTADRGLRVADTVVGVSSVLDGALTPGAVVVVNQAGDGFEMGNTTLTGDMALRANLAAAGGANLVGYLDDGTGANLRGIDARLRGRCELDVLSFIPPAQLAAIKAGTSTFDCGPYIQKAIDALAVLGGGTLFFPAGVYRTRQTLLVTHSGSFLRGVGGGWIMSGQSNIRASAPTRIEWDPTLTPGAGTAVLRFAIAANGNYVHGGGVADLMLDCNTVCPIGLNLVSWSRGRFDRMTVFAASADHYLLQTSELTLIQSVGACQHNRFTECLASTSGGTGWYLTNQSRGWRFQGGSALNSGDSSINTLVNCRAQMSLGNPYVLENCGQNLFISCWGGADQVNTTPVIASLVKDTAGGSLPAGTYTYRVAAENNNTGEITTASAEVSLTVIGGTTNRVQINWNAVGNGTTHYRVFGRAAGAEFQIARVTSNFLSVFDDGSVASGAAILSRPAFGVILGSYDQSTATGPAGATRYHCFVFCETTFYARAAQTATGGGAFGIMVYGLSNGDVNYSPVTFETPGAGNTQYPQVTYFTSGTGQLGVPALAFAGKFDVDANVTNNGYFFGGTKVVGARQTGWTAGSGTPLKAAFNADSAVSISATYVQTELQAVVTAQVATKQRVLALETAMRAHGLIN